MDARDKLLKVLTYLMNIESSNLKSNKSLKIELEAMAKKISEGGYIPPVLEALVDENYVDGDKSDVEVWENIEKNILYPLPSSHNQKEVARRLCRKFAVVVDGSPGTGKSHTAANLICHLAANGKRVLVTSEKDKALKVIYDKIPEKIRPLCINVGDGNIDSLNELDKSIKNITESLDIDTDKLSRELQCIDKELKDCKNKKKFLKDNLKTAETAENREIEFFGKKIKLLAVKAWLDKNEKQYSWIEDDIKYPKKPSITDAKFSRLIYLISNVSKEEMKQFSEIGALIYNIPSCSQLTSKLMRIIELKKDYISYKKAIKDWCVSYNSDYDYDYIMKLLENAQKFLEGLNGTWLLNILDSVRKGETVKEVLQQTILRCNFYIKKLGNILKEISKYNVEMPKEMDVFTLANEFEIIYKQFEQKGKVRRLFKLFHAQCDNILSKCSVDGQPIQTKEQAKVVKMYIDKCCTEVSLINLWNNSMKEYGAKEIDTINLSMLADLEENINKIDVIINWDIKVKEKIVDSMKKIVFLNRIDWYSIETFKNLQYGVLSIKYLSEYENLKSDINNLSRIIGNIDGFEKVAKALRDNDILALKTSYKKIERLKEIAPFIREIQYLLDRVGKDCPKLVNKLLNEEDKLHMLVNYKNFSLAWSWRELKNIFDDECRRFSQENIKRELKLEKEREISLVNDLACKKVWYNTISKIKEKEKRSLYAWREAVKRFKEQGNRSGFDYSKLAKKEMNNFKNSLPIWIMPLNKVIEYFSVYDKPFDVVIIDEGTESNIFAISALIRAKKAVIFGDDKMVNADKAQNSCERVQKLISQYLKEVPHSEWFDMRTSIYSTALRVFPDRVKLSKNFRSVPEIESICYRLCSHNEETSKDFSKNTFESVAMAVKVNGERDKIKPINIKEAESIVNMIVQCCKNPKYEEMTMGVISLLGDVQCEVINNMIREKLDMEEICKRKLTCGNPYSFKGDERDVIFLSMVIANNVKFAALTREGDMRRFSLAVSRARKEIWLFHSVDLQDLNPECVRAKLLKCCTRFDVAGNSKKVKEIYKIA